MSRSSSFSGPHSLRQVCASLRRRRFGAAAAVQMDRVTVVVRVRPWLRSDHGPRRSIVRISGASTELLDPQDGSSRALFAFDRCFDSLSATDENLDQQRVFDAIAPPLLTSCIEGYNVTMLAYGQTVSLFPRGVPCTLTSSGSCPFR